MINYDLQKIKGMAFDVDGVLSQPSIIVAEDQLLRTTNVKDGYALQLAAKMGLHLAIITGGRGKAITERYHALGFQDVYTSCKNKIDTLELWMRQYGLQCDEVLYMGDDIPDYQVMQQVGCSCSPADAAHEIKDISTYVSPVAGGQGCVRDVVEQVLRAQGLWMSSAEAFGW